MAVIKFDNGFTQKADDKAPAESKAVIKKDSVKMEKKGIGRKMVDAFIVNDIKTVTHTTVKEYVKPQAARILWQGISSIIGKVLGVDTSNAVYNSMVKNNSFLNSGSNNAVVQASNPEQLKVYDYTMMSVQTQDDARLVIQAMMEAINTYGRVRVSDLYEYMGKTNFGYPCNDYGWTKEDMVAASAVEREGRWIFSLPRAKMLD